MNSKRQLIEKRAQALAQESCGELIVHLERADAAFKIYPSRLTRRRLEVVQRAMELKGFKAQVSGGSL